MFKVQYIIKKEMMGGEWYYMIYGRWLCFDWFLERWNTVESAKQRVDEMRNPISHQVPYI